MKKLNLGCGKVIKEGYINTDLASFKGVDKVFNLNNFPYPFEDNEFDEVLLISVLEHLENTPKVIEELHRITKENGEIIIEVPHFSSFWIWTDITHKRPYSYFSLGTYDIDFKSKDLNGVYEKVGKDIKFVIKKKVIVSKAFKWLGMQIIADKIPYVYERFLAYHFPAGNIIFKLYPIKKERISNRK